MGNIICGHRRLAIVHSDAGRHDHDDCGEEDNDDDAGGSGDSECGAMGWYIVAMGRWSR